MSEPAPDSREAIRPRPVRITDRVYDQLSVVAALEGTSVTAAITAAIEDYIAARRQHGDLSSRATQALAEIDRDAAARRAAIESLLAAPDATSPGQEPGEGEEAAGQGPDGTGRTPRRRTP